MDTNIQSSQRRKGADRYAHRSHHAASSLRRGHAHVAG